MWLRTANTDCHHSLWHLHTVLLSLCFSHVFSLCLKEKTQRGAECWLPGMVTIVLESCASCFSPVYKTLTCAPLHTTSFSSQCLSEPYIHVVDQFRHEALCSQGKCADVPSVGGLLSASRNSGPNCVA